MFALFSYWFEMETIAFRLFSAARFTDSSAEKHFFKVTATDVNFLTGIKLPFLPNDF